jgi:hypothetical protein
MNRRGWSWAPLLFTLAAPAAAQRLGPGGVTAGAEAVTYRFDRFFPVRALSQWALPLGAVVARGRWMLDIGTHLAGTTVSRQDGTSLTVTDFTDTQLRGAYVFGDDALVTTVVLNLPTGASSLSEAEYTVLAAASSAFFAFPVNAYGSGTSVTAGAAFALPADSWNLGLAGSVRWSDDFTPFRTADGPFTYRAGLEGRLRAGADRLIGSARLSLGLTFSTFANDQFSNGAGTAGLYRPGRRFVLEGAYETLVGSASLTFYAWDFFRLAGDSAGSDARNRENVLTGGVRASVPLTRTLLWDSRLEARGSWPEEGKGALAEARSALRLRVSRRFSVIPEIRLGLGRLEEPPPGIGHGLVSYGLSVFIRESF